MKILSSSMISTAALGTLMCAASAFGATLNPGGTVTAPYGNLFADLGAQVGATQISPTGSFGASSSGTLTSAVFDDTVNTGDLDFVYQYTVTSGDLSSLSIGGFNGFNIDAGVSGTAPTADFTANTNNPSSIARPVSTVVDIVYGSATTQTTAIVILRTNAPTAVLSNVGVNEGGSTNVLAWTPAPEPGQSALLLGGLFSVGLFFARKYAVKRT
jgi:hypothetical protein